MRRLRPNLDLDLDELQQLSEPLGFFFYLLMFVAVLAFFAGATGTGVVMLIAGAGLHVVRGSIEELAAERRAQAERKREVRLRSHRAPRKVRETRPAAEAIRVTAAPQVGERRRSPGRPKVSGYPDSGGARKQRVI
jgi:hypothetical protein